MEQLLEKYAGTGRPVGKTSPGIAGYKERVDFKEIIGKYIEEGKIDGPVTTIGHIHYDAKGFIHLVPAQPL
jgi:hypothetical protein